MSASTGATTFGANPLHQPSFPDPQPVVERPVLLDGAGAVTALRRRPVVPAGAIGTDRVATGRRLVAARDLLDASWWIPASSVWSDAEVTERPEHPWHVGLATEPSWSRAVLTGLSSRLGAEAKLAHDRGDALPVLHDVGPSGPAVVYDGRLGHDIPTVLLVSENVVRSGAGVTFESAYRRALYGDVGTPDEEVVRELHDLELVLADASIQIAVVDLGTSLLRRSGISRVSVQLMLG